MTCDQLTEHWTEYLDGELSADATRRVEDHLGACPECRTTADELAATVGLLRRLPPKHAPAGFAEDVQREIERRLILSDGPDAGDAPERSLAIRRRSPLPHILAMAATVALAAGIAVLVWLDWHRANAPAMHGRADEGPVETATSGIDRQYQRPIAKSSAGAALRKEAVADLAPGAEAPEAPAVPAEGGHAMKSAAGRDVDVFHSQASGLALQSGEETRGEGFVAGKAAGPAQVDGMLDASGGMGGGGPLAEATVVPDNKGLRIVSKNGGDLAQSLEGQSQAVDAGTQLTFGGDAINRGLEAAPKGLEVTPESAPPAPAALPGAPDQAPAAGEVATLVLNTASSPEEATARLDALFREAGWAPGVGDEAGDGRENQVRYLGRGVVPDRGYRYEVAHNGGRAWVVVTDRDRLTRFSSALAAAHDLSVSTASSGEFDGLVDLQRQVAAYEKRRRAAGQTDDAYFAKLGQAPATAPATAGTAGGAAEGRTSEPATGSGAAATTAGEKPVLSDTNADGRQTEAVPEPVAVPVTVPTDAFGLVEKAERDRQDQPAGAIANDTLAEEGTAAGPDEQVAFHQAPSAPPRPQPEGEPAAVEASQTAASAERVPVQQAKSVGEAAANAPAQPADRVVLYVYLEPVPVAADADGDAPKAAAPVEEARESESDVAADAAEARPAEAAETIEAAPAAD